MANRTKKINPSHRRRTLLYTLGGIFSVAVLALALVVFNYNQSQAQTTDADDAHLVLVAGIQGQAENLDLTTYAGQVVVVNFMAGWCASCWAEIPDFVEVYESHQAEGLVMLGISLQTPEIQTLSMIEDMGISYPVFQDEEGKVALERFGLRAMPTTFIFNREGQLAKRLDGEVTGKTLLAEIKNLL